MVVLRLLGMLLFGKDLPFIHAKINKWMNDWR